MTITQINQEIMNEIAALNNNSVGKSTSAKKLIKLYQLENTSGILIIKTAPNKFSLRVKAMINNVSILDESIKVKNDNFKDALAQAIKVKQFTTRTKKVPSKTKMKLFELGYPENVDSRGITYNKAGENWYVRYDINKSNHELEYKTKLKAYSDIETAIEKRDFIMKKEILGNPLTPLISDQRFGPGRNRNGNRNIRGLNITARKNGQVNVTIKYNVTIDKTIKVREENFGSTSSKREFFSLVEQAVEFRNNQDGLVTDGSAIDIDFDNLLNDLNLVLVD